MRNIFFYSFLPIFFLQRIIMQICSLLILISNSHSSSFSKFYFYSLFFYSFLTFFDIYRSHQVPFISSFLFFQVGLILPITRIIYMPYCEGCLQISQQPQSLSSNRVNPYALLITTYASLQGHLKAKATSNILLIFCHLYMSTIFFNHRLI